MQRLDAGPANWQITSNVIKTRYGDLSRKFAAAKAVLSRAMTLHTHGFFVASPKTAPSRRV
jgi:hypothetical protein